MGPLEGVQGINRKLEDFKENRVRTMNVLSKVSI